MNIVSAHSAKTKHWLLGIVMLVLVLVCDQLSKYWILNIFDLPEKRSVEILPFLNFTMVWNKAITFGMLGDALGQYAPIIFAVVAFSIAVGLFVWMIRAPKRCVVLSLGAIIGGAIGNIIDRVRFGAVVDFIHLHVSGWSWYVFNIADSAIVCGVGVLLIDAFFRKDSKH
ncbi:Lipoprotein signal peptidase (LspA) (PDB:5DIR) [Commensalibacter communis]|uniref:signal peptidase II n=1 Tax=Commensalibacter communis TaxID=2972786 RepID=UPI0022FF7CF3|nr:signal peptidase II [Commensalibacter communis]CAI3928413.1 Lipoprotein signal peptidase (LspA) (PDB:5DIR) [Commensalibacter communis]CAI3930847.1 Lipoprotein signal peptidase (LspA) (PDB:5DIR) [Commensalibacter communis]